MQCNYTYLQQPCICCILILLLKKRIILHMSHLSKTFIWYLPVFSALKISITLTTLIAEVERVLCLNFFKAKNYKIFLRNYWIFINLIFNFFYSSFPTQKKKKPKPTLILLTGRSSISPQICWITWCLYLVVKVRILDIVISKPSFLCVQTVMAFWLLMK